MTCINIETLQSYTRQLTAQKISQLIHVPGLGDHAGLSKVTADTGQDLVCASTGSCSNRSDRMTMLRVSYPKQGSNGKVEIIEVKGEEKAASSPNGKQEKKNAEAVTEGQADTISVESL